MKGIVDRIEGNIAVVELESREMVEIELAEEEVSEGDVVEIENGKLIVDRESTESRAKQIEDMFNSLIE